MALWDGLQYQWHGAAVWFWISTLIILPIVNEIVNRSKLTAQSLIQCVGNAIKASPLVVVPVIKVLFIPVADLLGTPKTASLEGAEVLAMQHSNDKGDKGSTKLGVIAVIAGGTLAWVILSCGCATPGGKAFVACELDKLPDVGQSVALDIATIVNSGGTDWQTQLDNMVASVGAGQVDCAIQAVIAAWTQRGAGISSVHADGVKRLEWYRANHAVKS